MIAYISEQMIDQYLAHGWRDTGWRIGHAPFIQAIMVNGTTPVPTTLTGSQVWLVKPRELQEEKA